ncbi:MAG: YggS family pyridoxal phosphate-dependent enzyme [Myxococcota bacterium]
MALTAGLVEARLAALRERVAAAARRSGREPEAITLVGVSKRKPAEAVAAAVCAGLRDVGESYVQEAAVKLVRVAELLGEEGPPAPRYHFVGGLQRNKARQAARLFQVVESVDRLPLARELSRAAQAEGRSLEVLLQVDLAGESRKGGATAGELPRLLEACADLPGLAVVGLMALPPANPDPEASRPYFQRLRELRDSLAGRAPGPGLRELSMGMSTDFEVAIEEGATWVRVGTALFGPREG